MRARVSECPSAASSLLSSKGRRSHRLGTYPLGKRQRLASASSSVRDRWPLIQSRGPRYRALPQKRWMRLQASSSSAVEAAYEMRKNGLMAKAAPCTQATPSSSSRDRVKSWSELILAPLADVLPITPAQEG